MGDLQKAWEGQVRAENARLQSHIDEIRAEQDQLRLENNRLQATNEHQQKELERLQKVRVLECSVCCLQRDVWVTLSCTHMYCKECANTAGYLDGAKDCGICRKEVSGYATARPFAG